jgi:hypothetical protein
MMDDVNVLEVLRAARARVQDPENLFDFNDWTVCTCGHIYAGATGQATTFGANVTQPIGAYAEVITATARALGWNGTPGEFSRDYAPVRFVSAYTSARIDVPYQDRQAALQTLDDAIREVERMEADAMRTVAGLDGPSKTIIVEPVHVPVTVPEPEPEREPVEVPDRETGPVPA